MPGPKGTLDEYLSDRTRQLSEDLGARVQDITVVDVPGNRAVVNARLVFQGEVITIVLKVLEEIRVIDGRPIVPSVRIGGPHRIPRAELERQLAERLRQAP
jgi:hypothetical protein